MTKYTTSKNILKAPLACGPNSCARSLSTQSIPTFTFYQRKYFSSTQRICEDFKLKQNIFNKEVGRWVFSNRVVKEWNNLPQEVVMADSANSFKNSIDKSLSGSRFLSKGNPFYSSMLLLLFTPPLEITLRDIKLLVIQY